MKRLRIVSAAIVATALLTAGCGGQAGATSGGDDAARAKQPRQVVEHATKLTIGQDRSPPNTLIHGKVYSAVRTCEVGRRLAVFKKQAGTDRLLATVRSEPVHPRYAAWDRSFRQAKAGWHVYAKARRAERRSGVVCLRARSPIYTVIRVRYE